MARYIKYLFWKSEGMCSHLKNSQDAGSSNILQHDGRERQKKMSCDAHTPPNLASAAVNNRDCLKQGRRYGLVPAVVLWVPYTYFGKDIHNHTYKNKHRDTSVCTISRELGDFKYLFLFSVYGCSAPMYVCALHAPLPSLAWRGHHILGSWS